MASIHASIELTVTEWPGDGRPPRVVGGPWVSPFLFPADDVSRYEGYLAAPLHESAAAQLRVRLSGIHPAHPGWFAAVAYLEGPAGQVIGRMRPVTFYGRRNDVGTHIYFPETYDGSSFSCELRIVSGGLE